MKKMIQMIILVVGLLSSTSAIAYPFVEPSVKVNKQAAKSLVVRINNLVEQQAVVELVDVQGIVLHTERIKNTTAFAKVFDLRVLPTGKYLIQVNTKDRVFEQWVTIGNSGVVVTSDLKKWKKPTIVQSGNNVMVELMSYSDKKGKVTILDEENTVLHQDEFTKVGVAKTKYDLTALEAGDYLLKVEIGDFVYYEYVTVR